MKKIDNEYQNIFLGGLVEDGNSELAEIACQNMASQGQFPRDNQGEKIELEGTLTLEIEK